MRKQSSDTLKVAILLTFIGGFLEIYSFLLKGKVFATTITGNIVLMIYSIYNFNFKEITKYLFPIIFFIIGIVLVEMLRDRFKKSSIHWREYIVILEVVLILIIFIFKDNKYNLLTISIISFMSAVQIQTFKKIEETIYMSTMCTGNTRKMIESIVKKDKNGIKIFTSVVLSFAMGVIVGAIGIEYLKEMAILLLTLPLLSVLFLIHKNI
ncbi:YoaK family protein [Oceanivirga salmonicida]|uniref:YoaK family protein n=1 Tax=Oceanivirga salmonicida TaxID=1769291 RepID=UPI0008333D0F|nr:YoaK family protein [Oceanivirga salmonicida]